MARPNSRFTIPVMKVLSLVVLAVIFTLATTSARAYCSCVEVGGATSVAERVSGAWNASSAVFLGKATRFEYVSGLLKNPKATPPALNWETKVVYFQIEQWWKLANPAEEKFLITDEIKMDDGGQQNSSCDVYFRVGESYLVFANGSEGRLSTHACTLTGPASSRKSYLEALGEGKPPIRKFEAEKPKVSSFDRGFLFSVFNV